MFHEFDEGASKCPSSAVVQKNKVVSEQGQKEPLGYSHRGTSLGQRGVSCGLSFHKRFKGTLLEITRKEREEK